MNCPICGRPMEAGGLVLNGVQNGWVPLEQFQRKGLQRLVYVGTRFIGRENYLLRQTLVPNAWYCRRCGKIAGVFDVTNNGLEP